MRTIGVYVQVPFCQTKCTYCNFHTGVVASNRFAPYVEAVCGEIRGHRELLRAAGVDWAGLVGGRPPLRTAPSERDGQSGSELRAADTVYIGGGTPSLLDPSHLQNILDAVRENFAGQLAEVTLEADPETVEAEKAGAWVRAGINRVSFGLQSFVDKELVAAGRMHRRADIYRAVPILRAAGIRNISFDLIAGLPFQTRESWKQSLGELAELAPEHVSVYLLEIDEGSRLGTELLAGGKKYSAGAVPTEDEMAEFYELAQETLGAAGYHHYEISNWAKPGFESKHNLKYWRREPYLGFGAGAHSFSGTARWANAHDAAGYVAAVQAGRLPVEQHEKVTAEAALEEELFLGLRQLDGIDIGRIEKDYGVALAGRFDGLTAAGLIEREGSLVRLAGKKLSVSNEVFVELMR
jgi:oxygen-independent coproporphyrinogen III oxidase